MKPARAFPRPNRDNGFILVTSLIFLVVITLLAVSAISSSTLQEHMASNLRDRSRATQAADAALRQGEMLLGQTLFDTYQPAGNCYPKTSDNQSCGGNRLKVWPRSGMFADNAGHKSTAFLDAGVWKTKSPQTYIADPGMPAVDFFVEDYAFQGRSTNPGENARGDGTVIYRITARARGKNPAAIAVTQSFYAKRY